MVARQALSTHTPEALSTHTPEALSGAASLQEAVKTAEEADLEFIAHARTAIPVLITNLRRMTRLVEQYEAAKRGEGAEPYTRAGKHGPKLRLTYTVPSEKPEPLRGPKENGSWERERVPGELGALRRENARLKATVEALDATHAMLRALRERGFELAKPQSGSEEESDA